MDEEQWQAANETAIQLQHTFDTTYSAILLHHAQEGWRSVRQDCGVYVQSLVQAGMVVLRRHVYDRVNDTRIFAILAGTTMYLQSVHPDWDIFHPGCASSIETLPIRHAHDRQPSPDLPEASVVVINVIEAGSGYHWRCLVDFDNPVSSRGNGIFVAPLHPEDYHALAGERQRTIAADGMVREYQPASVVPRVLPRPPTHRSTPPHVLWPRPLDRNEAPGQWLADMQQELEDAVQGAYDRRLDPAAVAARYGIGLTSGRPNIPIDVRFHIIFRYALSRAAEEQHQNSEPMFWWVHGRTVNLTIDGSSREEQRDCRAFTEGLDVDPGQPLHSWDYPTPPAVRKVEYLTEQAVASGLYSFRALDAFGLRRDPDHIAAVVRGAQIYKQIVDAVFRKQGLTGHMDNIQAALNGIQGIS